MTKKEKEPLIRDDVLMSAVELCETRWHGMHPRIAAAKLKEWGVPAIRLGARTIKYRLSDIVQVENEAATRTTANFRKKKAETGHFNRQGESAQAAAKALEETHERA